MPWTCNECQAEHEADSLHSCSECGWEKPAWTMVEDQTREFALTRRRRSKFRCLRGDQLERPAASAPPSGSWTPTRKAPVLRKAQVQALVEAGCRPAPHDLVRVRLERRAGDSLTLGVAIDYAERELAEHELPYSGEPPPGRDPVERTLLLVCGPGPAPEVPWAGIEVLDVSEEGEPGYAPGIEVAALGRPPEELETELVAARVRILELDDVNFGTARAILLPEGNPELGPDEGQGLRRGLEAVRAALDYAALYHHKRLVVAGHTDTVGSAESNRALSAARAENVHLYVTGQREAWAEHCQAHFARADFKAIQVWAAREKGWDLDPGPLDDSWHEQARKARDAFRVRLSEEYGHELERHVAQSAADWAAIYDLYDDALTLKLGMTPEGLEFRRSMVLPTEPPTLACGEEWPTERVGEDDAEVAANRRVDLIFLDPGELDLLVGEPAGVGIYGTGVEREYLPFDPEQEEDPSVEFYALLMDESGYAPLACKWTIDLGEGETFSGETGADGVISAKQHPLGHYVLRVDLPGAEPIAISSRVDPQVPHRVLVPGVPAPRAFPEADEEDEGLPPGHHDGAAGDEGEWP